jgi:dihydroxyacetone kinase-like protein
VVYRTEVGTWLTAQEMAGFSVTLMKLDGELKRYLDEPCASLGYSRA